VRRSSEMTTGSRTRVESAASVKRVAAFLRAPVSPGGRPVEA
jgi:hypothetical protein